MLWKTVRLLFHFSVLLQHFVVIWCLLGIYHTLEQMDYASLPQGVQDLLDFRLLFFTSWNSIIQLSYFVMAAAHDVFIITGRNNEWTRKLDTWKGYFFVTFAFPFCFFVGAMFWIIFSINREYVFPQVLDEYIPSWINHAVHTNIMIFTAVETLMVRQQMPDVKKALCALTALHVIYDILYYVIFFIKGRWIYLLYYALSWPERLGVMLLNYIMTLVIFFIGVYIENYKSKLGKEKKCLNDANKQLIYEKVQKSSDGEKEEEQSNGLTK
ncbi:androgen-dependent TFPI-regulating protein-like [Rhynchophorus ferrugineus]|uniref:androgen-dependent TFPI-regulating protein-like n=1 Tax=Rhynchophorus ferrugineus TaxID=354439 RepID=UPI003FCD7193